MDDFDRFIRELRKIRDKMPLGRDRDLLSEAIEAFVTVHGPGAFHEEAHLSEVLTKALFTLVELNILTGFS